MPGPDLESRSPDQRLCTACSSTMELSSMLCLECATRSPLPRVRHLRETVPSLEGLTRIRSLVCSGCGGLLPLTDSTDGLLSKLIQLDRFGLGAFAGPLLHDNRSVPCGES